MVKKNWPLIITNTLFFAGMMIVNTLATTLPINGKGTGELSDGLPNLFVPAGLTFSIWGIIYLSLLGFIIYQYTGKSKEYKTIGPWFIINSVMNMSWIFAWHYEHVFLSILIMFGLLGSLIIIYLKLNKPGKEKPSFGENFLVYFPFSIYLGWITVATVANITTGLVSIGWQGWGLGESVWTVIMIIATTLICGTILIRQKDSAYTAVIVWALLGIIIKRSSTTPVYGNIILTAAIAGGLLFIGALILGIREIVKKR